MKTTIAIALLAIGLSACHAPPPGSHHGGGMTAHQSWCAEHPYKCRDRDDNPPGLRGGRGTNWENPADPRGGPGASPDRDRRRW